MKAVLRMKSGNVLRVDNFGPRSADDLTDAEREFVKQANAVLDDVPGGWMIVNLLDSGETVGVACEAIETVMPLP